MTAPSSAAEPTQDQIRRLHREGAGIRLPAIAAQLAAGTTRCGHPTIASYSGARP